MKILFKDNGQVLIGEGKAFEGGYDLPDGASTLADRYALKDGEVVDLYPGLSDEEVMEKLEAERQQAMQADGVQVAPSRELSRLEFMDLFTEKELAGIYQAAKSNALIEVWLDKLKVTESIDLSNPRVQKNIDALVAAQLISPERAEQIKAGIYPEV